MKYKIRKGVFETNSSSVHSLCLDAKTFEKPDFKIKKKMIDGEKKSVLVVPLSYFGKQGSCMTQMEKLSYLCTIAYIKDGYSDIEELNDSWSWNNFKDELKKYCKEHGVIFNDILLTNLDEAGIDHQSYDDYGSISDFKINYTDFIFCPYISLKMECD